MLEILQFTKTLSQEDEYSVSPAILFYGREWLLIQLAISKLRQILLTRSFSQKLNFTDLSNDIDKAIVSMQTQDMFNSKKIIEINLQKKIPTTVQKKISALIELANQDTILIINAKCFDNKLPEWLKKLQTGKLELIYARALNYDNLIRWIDLRAKELGIQLQRDSLLLLSDLTRGNLASAEQSLQRLTLLDSHEPLAPNVIVQLNDDQSEFETFALSTTMLEGNLELSNRQLKQLQKSGTDIILVAWIVARDLHQLLVLKQSELELGHGAGEKWFTKWKLWADRKQKLILASKRHTIENLVMLNRKMLQVDMQIKGLAFGNSWSTLYKVVSEICTPNLTISD